MRFQVMALSARCQSICAWKWSKNKLLTTRAGHHHDPRVLVLNRSGEVLVATFNIKRSESLI